MSICRIPELLFQPSMLGIDQGGLAELIEFVLKKFSSDDQNRLVQVSKSRSAHVHFVQDPVHRELGPSLSRISSIQDENETCTVDER